MPIRILHVFIVLLVGSSILLFSCKKKPLTKPSEKALSLEEVMVLQEFTFEEIQGSGNVKFNNGKTSIPLNLTFRIKKDSMLWASFGGPFGIEGARVLLNTDSFFVLNRLQKMAMIGPLSALKKVVGTSIQFPVLQNLFVGNIPYPSNLDSGDVIKVDSSKVHLQQSRSNYLLEAELDRSLGRMTNLNISSQDSSITIKTAISEFITINGFEKFPSQTMIVVANKAGEELAETNISIKKVENASGQSYLLNIPNSYKLVRYKE